MSKKKIDKLGTVIDSGRKDGKIKVMIDMGPSVTDISYAMERLAAKMKMDAIDFTLGPIKAWAKSGFYTRVQMELFDDMMINHFIEALEAQMTREKSPFKKGREGYRKSKTGGGSRFVSLKDGESITFAPLVGLDGMVSSDMHEHWDVNPAPIYPCIGRNCPGCALGDDSRWKGYLPVYTKEGDVMVFPFTQRTYNKLTTIEDEMEDKSLKGRAMKVRRTGTGFDTEYTPVLLGRDIDVGEVDMPDFVDWLGPVTEEDIIELLEERGIETPGYDKSDEDDDDGVEPDGPHDEEDDDDAWGDV